MSEPSDTDNSSDSSSDSSSSSKHRSKKSKKKSKKHAKSKKQVKKDKKAQKQERRDKKALLTETGPEKKARMALAKARDQASAKVQSSKKKNAEHMVGKLATALAGITLTIGKMSFDFIPGMIKDPMMDAYTELQSISATAVLIVQSEGKLDEEIPDQKAGISDISKSNSL
jgi:flagellar biosynthesis GTPase FlhF